MNTLSKKIIVLAILLITTVSNTLKAQSTVYFFVDFRWLLSEYIFIANGNEAFRMIPEGKPIVKGYDTMMYNMVARKVIFKNPGSYVVSCGYINDGVDYDAKVNLNLEDGETYYVILNRNVKRFFYMELLEEKAGLKLLKKAQTSKKYTFNDDFVYDGN